jgi:hypothetical protein
MDMLSRFAMLSSVEDTSNDQAIPILGKHTILHPNNSLVMGSSCKECIGTRRFILTDSAGATWNL